MALSVEAHNLMFWQQPCWKEHMEKFPPIKEIKILEIPWKIAKNDLYHQYNFLNWQRSLRD